MEIHDYIDDYVVDGDYADIHRVGKIPNSSNEIRAEKVNHRLSWR